MKRLGYSSLVLIGLLTTYCNSEDGQYEYPKDQTISDEHGNPKDSTVSFFPKTLIYKDTSIQIDPYNWFSANLRIAKEKILYNSYLGFDSYRFTWLRSFDKPVFITINKQDHKYWMTVKMLSKPYVQYHEVIKFVPPYVTEGEKNLRQEEHDRMMDTLRLPPRIAADKRIEISKDDWDTFQQQLAQSNFWSVEPADPRLPGLDGSNWIIEGHLKTKYWVVERWSPKDNFRQCGEYLIRLSGVDQEIY